MDLEAKLINMPSYLQKNREAERQRYREREKREREDKKRTKLLDNYGKCITSALTCVILFKLFF